MKKAIVSVPSPVGHCDGCGAPNGLLRSFHEGYTEYQCPNCMTRSALHDAAQTSLQDLIQPIVEVWWKHWCNTLDPQCLNECLEGIGLDPKDYAEEPPTPQAAD